MEEEVTWAGARRKRDCGGIVGREPAGAFVKFPNKNPIESQIHMQDETARSIGLNHVRMGSVVATEGEAAGWCIRGFSGSNCAGILFDVGGGAEMAVRLNRQHGDGAAKIIGYEHKLAGGMKAHIGRAGTAGRDSVKQSEVPVGAIDGERAYSAFVVVADAVGLIGGIKASAGG